jgi:hypothetical protein
LCESERVAGRDDGSPDLDHTVDPFEIHGHSRNGIGVFEASQARGRCFRINQLTDSSDDGFAEPLFCSATPTHCCASPDCYHRDDHPRDRLGYGDHLNS